MLQLIDGNVVESMGTASTNFLFSGEMANGGLTETIGTITTTSPTDNGSGYWINGIFHAYPYQQVAWNNFPIYICTDKTAKAIEILKMLEKEKLIELKSVSKFISYVEKIVATL